MGAATGWLMMLGCALGCSGPARARTASMAETAPASENAAPSASAHPLQRPRPTKAAAPSESAADARSSEATAEPASHDLGCGSDAGTPAWLGSGASPEAGWWRPFTLRHPSRAKPVKRGGWAPIADLEIFGMTPASSVLRVQQSRTMGKYKLCYREALYKDLALSEAAGRPPLQGDWVARFTQRADRICAVDVLETSLPSEVSDCLRSSALQEGHAGAEEGQFEIALVFRVPYTLPAPNGNQSSAR
jgi:hypothetical protein